MAVVKKTIGKGKTTPRSGIHSVDDLSYESRNKDILDFFRKEGMEIGAICVVTDIRPTKTEGKSSVYCVASVDLGTSVGGASFDTMSAAERLAQGFSGNMLQRGRITFADTILEQYGVEKGSELVLGDIEFTLRIYEQRNEFYDGQQPVGFINEAGEYEAKLKDGEEFYRDSKVCTTEELSAHGHELL